MNESQLTLTKCKLYSNGICGLEATNKSFIQITNGEFKNNINNSINLLHSSTANIINVNFIKNGGDAIKISTDSCISMEDCKFEENSVNKISKKINRFFQKDMHQYFSK